jgi:hypothetical protein
MAEFKPEDLDNEVGRMIDRVLTRVNPAPQVNAPVNPRQAMLDTIKKRRA